MPTACVLARPCDLSLPGLTVHAQWLIVVLRPEAAQAIDQADTDGQVRWWGGRAPVQCQLGDSVGRRDRTGVPSGALQRQRITRQGEVEERRRCCLAGAAAFGRPGAQSRAGTVPLVAEQAGLPTQVVFHPDLGATAARQVRWEPEMARAQRRIHPGL